MNARGLVAACILGSGITFLDGSVVNVALPAMRADLDAGLATQQWVVEAYLLALGALLLIGGSLGDVLGRRRVFNAGLIGFAVASALCAIAPTGATLIAARGLQGIAGALLVPASLAIITAAFGEPERSKAIGTWTAWTGIAFIIGPLGGGALIDLVSWRWIFAINVPLIALNLWMVRRWIPDSLDVRTGGSVDWAGAALCAAGLGGPVFALIEQPRYGWGDPVVLVPLLAGAALFAAFLVHESRTATPMLPLSLFRIRNFAWGNAATLVIYGGLGAVTFFVTIYLQQMAGWSATAAGLALLPTTLMLLVLSQRFGALAGRLGPRLFMGVGPLIAAAGTLLMGGLGTEVDFVSDLLPGVLLFGLGLAVTVAPLTAAILNAAPVERAGVASGANNAIARVAALLAIAAVGAVVAGVYGDAAGEPLVAGAGAAATAASQDAYQAAIHVAAALIAAGGLLSLAGIRRPQSP